MSSGFFKQSRLGSEGDSFENVHRPVEAERDVFSSDLASLRCDDAELQEEGRKAERKSRLTSNAESRFRPLQNLDFCNGAPTDVQM